MDAINTGNQLSKGAKKNGELEKKWFSTAELEFIVPGEVSYNYGKLDNNGKLLYGNDSKLNKKVSYGALYTINHPIFNKISLGAVGGFQHQTYPKISSLKIGSILRYHFVDYDNVNIYFMTAYNVALTDYIKSGMANVRLGLFFPVKKLSSFDLTLNIFWDYNFYNAKKPIFYGVNEKPGELTYKSYGISLGIKI